MLQWNRDTVDHIAHDGFGFVIRGSVALNASGKAHAMGEDGHDKFVNIIGDAVGASEQQGSCAGRSGEVHTCARGGPGTEQWGRTSSVQDSLQVCSEGSVHAYLLHLGLQGDEGFGLNHVWHKIDAVGVLLQQQPRFDLWRRVTNTDTQ